jgi:hypothetical protein
MSTASSLTIGQVAEQAGVRASRIRYYEQIGVLPQPDRIGGHRRYGMTCCAAWQSSTPPSASV